MMMGGCTIRNIIINNMLSRLQFAHYGALQGMQEIRVRKENFLLVGFDLPVSDPLLRNYIREGGRMY